MRPFILVVSIILVPVLLPFSAWGADDGVTGTGSGIQRRPDGRVQKIIGATAAVATSQNLPPPGPQGSSAPSAPVSFMPGLAEISVEGQELVRGISERVKALPRATIQLIGSFDLLGSSEYAIALLYRRLHEVEDALLKAGVHPSQIRKISRMNANPPAAEADRHSDVELRVVPVP